MNKLLPRLYQQAKNLPEQAGVYLMKNSKNQIIYVGKAKILPNRVKTYFQPKYPKSLKTLKLVEEIRNFEFLVVENETEALLLEYNLIKKHQPKYNIKLKNTQGYPYLCLNLNHQFPKLEVSYKPLKDSKVKFFGPYPNIKQLYEIKDFLNKSLKLRTCSDKELINRVRPCLLGQMNQCLAPCVNKNVDYSGAISKLLKILQGENSVIKELNQEMKTLAKAEQFEQAAQIRDLIIFAKKQKPIVDQIKTGRELYLNWVGERKSVIVGLLEISQGKVEGLQKIILENFEQESEENFIDKNLLKLIQATGKLYSKVLIPWAVNPTLKRLIETELGLKIIQQANKGYDRLIKDNLHQKEGLSLEQLENIQSELNLERVPYKIECIDISNWQESHPVGSKVAMIEGFLDKSEYRKYKLKTPGPNDFEMIKEVVLRRFNHPEEAFPDLLVVDGGQGQLKKAWEALEELKIQGVMVVGLAKDKVKSNFSSDEIKSSQERIVKLTGEEIVLNSKMSSFILTKLRDEAHRFALKFHRQLRSKNYLISGIKDKESQ